MRGGRTRAECVGISHLRPLGSSSSVEVALHSGRLTPRTAACLRVLILDRSSLINLPVGIGLYVFSLVWFSVVPLPC